MTPNIHTSELTPEAEYSRARVGELAGAAHLGVTIYELAPGQGMHFHYHLQREEVLIVLEGTAAVRTAEGWRDVPQGEVVAFARGKGGAHGYENRGETPIRLLMISEQNTPNVTLYPDSNEVAIYDISGDERRFGAVFKLEDDAD